jgi:glycosyltransferase involved in cell wall biosynthesis
MIDDVVRRAREFDVLHSHLDYMHFPVIAREPYPHLTTIHGRLDLPDVVPIYSRFRDLPLVSISRAQRSPLPFARWHATIHHGLPLDLYRFAPTHDRYLAFLGRICPEKRVDRAIEIAKRSGYRLRIAAKIDRVDRAYFADEIEPLMRQPHVDYIGEIDDAEKQTFLGGAVALLFPIDWPEPFGLVMIEAMACGTPVVAYRGGSVDEVIDEGVTGFVCDDIDSAVAAIGRCAALSRERCRARFEQRFSVTRMAADYVAAYRQLLEHSYGA